MQNNNIEPREAPSAPIIVDTMIDEHKTEPYMFTINVSTKKYINNKRWETYNTMEQEAFLLKMLSYCVGNHPMLELQYNTELTKKGNVHLHFSCYTTQQNVEKIQNIFHKRFGMPNLDPSICCDVTKNILGKSHADEYVNKQKNPEEADVCMFRKRQ